jgi:tetratricopeptide (TPR) repeat protein/tRNA A-37 threonylcarbamoyl transferase component Bud32
MNREQSFRTQSIGAELDYLCDSFERDWREGRAPSIEAYLSRASQPVRGVLFRELLHLDTEYRRRAGQTPRREEYATRFTDYATLLDTVFSPDHSTQTPASPDVGYATQALPAAGGTSPAAAAKGQPAARSPGGAGKSPHAAASPHAAGPQPDTGVATDVGGSPADDDTQGNASHTTVWTTEETCGRFQIVRPHARGGLGEVYLAQDGELRRPVALKRIQQRFVRDSAGKDRFLREAEITGKLEHPGIVPVYGLGIDAEGRPYYAMRFIRGETFKEAIDRFHKTAFTPSERSLELRRLLRRFLDVCNAIDYALSKGILHRDLKPANIMLGKHGETLVVDWGLAKIIGHDDPAAAHEDSLAPVSSDRPIEHTQEGLVVGTAPYMSPEQAEGRHDELGPATDVYGLGAVLYALLTGRNPVEAPDVVTILERVRRGEIVPPHQNADVPRPLSAVCMKALALRPQDRYPLPRDLAEDLEHWMADEPVSARKDTWSERQARWMRRHRTTAQTALGALVLVAVVAVGASIMIQGARTKEVRALRIATAAGRASELLEGKTWDAGRVANVEALVGELDDLQYDEAPQLRKRLPVQLAGFLDDSLRAPVIAASELERTKELVAVLERLDAAAAARLRPRIAERERDWQSQIAVAPPFVDASRAFDLKQFRLENDLLFPTHDGADPTALSRISSAGRVQLEATWNAAWEDSPAVGLILNADGDRKYVFLLCLSGFHLDPNLRRGRLTFATARTAGEPFDARIVRIDGDTETVLCSMPIAVASGELTLRAERVDDLLDFQINGQPGPSFADMFPIGTGSPGVLGLYWPKSVGLSRWEARRQALPATPSLLETADELFAQGEFLKAMELYERQAADFTSLAGKQQARYKQAVCLTQLARRPEALEVLAPVVGDLATTDRNDKANWPLRATFLTWLLHFQAGDYQEADRTFQKIENQTELRFADLARLVPAEDRRQILHHFRHDGQRFRLAYTRQRDLLDLERAVEIDKVINEDAGERWMTRWRLLDAYRAVGEGKPEEKKRELALADELLREAEALSPRVHLTMLRDYFWLLLEQNNPKAALAEVDQWLVRGPQFQRLLSERARIHYHLGDKDKALADLETFLEKVPADDTLDYYEYAEVCLMKGMLLAAKGDAAGAEASWRKGLPENVPEKLRKFPRSEPGRPLRGVDMNARAFSQDWLGMAYSLTGSATEPVAVQLLKDLTEGAGWATLAIQRILPKKFKPSFMRDVMNRIWTTPRGREEVEKLAFKQFNFRDHYQHGVRNILMTGIELGAFGKAGYPKEIEAQMWKESETLVNLFNDGLISEENMVQILAVWDGDFDPLDPVMKAFGPLRTTAAYIFGCRSIELEDPEGARMFFDQVMKEAPADSVYRADAAKRLATLPKE